MHMKFPSDFLEIPSGCTAVEVPVTQMLPTNYSDIEIEREARNVHGALPPNIVL